MPAGVLAQVWRDGACQARVAALIGDHRTEVEPLDRESAKAVGVPCGLTHTSDIVDASLVIAARSAGSAVIVSSDVEDLKRIDSSLRVERI